MLRVWNAHYNRSVVNIDYLTIFAYWGHSNSFHNQHHIDRIDFHNIKRDRRGRGRIVVGITIILAISAYHH